MNIKPSEALRFLGALVGAALVLGLVGLRVVSHHATPTATMAGDAPAAAIAPTLTTGPLTSPPPPVPRTAGGAANCSAAGWDAAAAANAASLTTLAWAPFGRPETGWEIYLPLIGREIGSACPPSSPGFAAALAGWEGRQGLSPDGVVSDPVFARLKAAIQMRRPFVRLSAQKICPEPPAEAGLETSRAAEGYGAKQVALRPAALAAYRAMAAAARAEDPAIAADPRSLTLFSGYRSPTADAARCAAEGNCNGVVRATCSAHRTGLAIDLDVGQAPGFGPDSSADPNRLFMSRSAAYRWMVANADRFGFVNYPFEPWHWEWTGEAP